MKKILLLSFAVPLAVFGLAVPASAARPGAEHVTITFDAATPGAPGTVVATGPISGTGTDTTLSSRQAGRTTHGVDLLEFATGSVTVKNMSVRVSLTVDPTTCALHEVDKGVFKITRGTGAYATAKGHGHFTITQDIQGTVDPSAPGGCNFDVATGSIVVDATGKVKL